MERLGLGPEVLLARNPRLVYGRMTGWGQSGPLAPAAGHDLNYLALSGALAAIGRAGAKPTPPLNLAADFGGGALYLAFGMACAMIEAKRSGRGQVVDAAMTEGAASLMTLFYGLSCRRAAQPRAGEQSARFRLGDLRHVRMRRRPLRRHRADRAQIPQGAVRAARPRLTPPTTGRRSSKNSKACSRPARGTTGARCSKEPTPASRRSSPWRKRRIIRTTSPAARSSKSTASCSRAPLRAFERTPAGIPTPPQAPGAGTRAALSTGALPQRKSITCSPPASFGEAEERMRTLRHPEAHADTFGARASTATNSHRYLAPSRIM